KNYRAMESSMDNIIATYYSQELYKEAADALFSLNELKDSITVIKNNERIQELAVQYNLEQNHLRLEQAESGNKLKTIILALVITLALGVIATLIIVFRMRRKRLIAIADAIYRGRKVEHKRVADLLVNDINEEIKHASQMFVNDPVRAQELLIDTEAKILRLANLNYSQAMEDHGIRGALEALAQSIKEDSGIDVHTRINLLDPLDREQEEDVFELSEKLLVHIVRFNETDLIHFEMDSRDGHFTITMKRKTEHASRRSSMYENLEYTVAHLSGEMVNQLDANGLTVTTIHV
ncbi:MAG: hypothetical protein KDC12_07090, partial [Flavobacteriales bacterium]|nr:hypothetical protein [Flavobacteriales bacterium]